MTRALRAARGLATATEQLTPPLALPRAVLRLSGADVHSFLQGLVTNDVRLLQRGAAGGRAG